MEPHITSKSGTSFFRTCFNGFNVLSGFGILSIPYALAQGGWLSFLLLLVMAIACCYTGLLLQRCMDSTTLVKTYPDIGEVAFGPRGRLLVAVFMYLELYLVAVEFLILEGDNLNKLFPATNFDFRGLRIGGKQGFTLLAALLILPTTWMRSLSVLAYISLCGVLTTIVVLLSVTWSGAFGGVGFHEKGVFFHWKGIPTAMSIYAFCYSGHAVYPTIYSSMKDKSMFPKVLFVCFGLATLNYGVMGVIGYLMFGQSSESQITLNLPVGKVSSKIAIFTTLMTPFAKYALMITPVANSIEEILGLGNIITTTPSSSSSSSSNNFMKSSSSIFKNSRVLCLLLRTLLVISTVIIAISVPFFGYVVSLTGAFLSSTATLILPCACYLKIFKGSRRWGFELATVTAVMAMGLAVAVAGTYCALNDIARNL